MYYYLTKNFLDDLIYNSYESQENVKFYLTEKADFYEIIGVIPGFEKEELNIEIEGNILTVSGENKQNNNFDLCSKFKKIFNLRDNKINFDRIDSSYRNGVLKINIFKKEEKNKVSKITIS